MKTSGDKAEIRKISKVEGDVRRENTFLFEFT